MANTLETLRLAEWLARHYHAGQHEQSTGDDYIHHIERVVALVDGDEAKTVAWLHDTLEDTALTDEELRQHFHPSIAGAVDILTRRPPFDYDTYISTVLASGSALAVAVKKADLRDHLRPNCPARLRPRYERAISRFP